jgi:hypothetical protein
MFGQLISTAPGTKFPRTSGAPSGMELAIGNTLRHQACPQLLAQQMLFD